MEAAYLEDQPQRQLGAPPTFQRGDAELLETGAAAPLRPGGWAPSTVLALQRQVGNAAVVESMLRRQLGDQERAFRHLTAFGPIVQRQPGAGAARVAASRALGWLARRGGTVSRHVARHTRRIAGRALHTVFRTPNQVKKLVRRTLEAPDNVLVQQGRRLRYVLEKQFGREIGKNGETVLHVVVEASGRIVTAYPVRALTRAGGAGAFVLVTLDTAAAEARSRLDAVEQEAQRRIAEAEPSFAEELFWDIVTFGLHGGSLNVGEDVYLWADRQAQQIQQETCAAVLAAVEDAEKRSLGVDERAQVCDLVTVALAHPDVLDALEEE